MMKFSIKLQALNLFYGILILSFQFKGNFLLNVELTEDSYCNNLQLELDSIAIDNLQSALNPGECLFYYHIKDCCLNAWFIDYESYRMNNISSNCGHSNLDDSKAIDLFTSLFACSDFLNPSKHKHIIIISENGIDDRPFDLFVDNNNKALIYNYSLSYQLAIEDFYQSRGQSKMEVSNEHLFSAYSFGLKGKLSHSYRSDINGMPSALLCSDKEVEEIVDAISLKKYGQIKNKAELISRLQDSDIVHLATHTSIDSGYRKLNIGNKLVACLEIESLKLRNELIVLSACETAKEEYSPSKGMISLARSFLSAGSKSVLVSLDKVDDCSTAKLMAGFYSYLNQGWAKDDALRCAKLDFIKHAHPERRAAFFWSKFIIVGDCQPIF